MKKKERKKSGSSKKNHRRESRHVGATDYFNPVQVENLSDVVGRVSHTLTLTHRVSERSNLSAAKDVNEGKVRVKRISFLAPR